MTEPLITPAMKVAALLETWPALEEVLVAQAPAFARLRNPVLRRTVARVATLEQAAGIAGLSSRDLVMTLRRAAGQPVDDAALPSGGPEPDGQRSRPAWLDPTRVWRVIDADAILDRGVAPLNAVFEAARDLPGGAILEVTASFRPIPLVESLRKQRYRCFLDGSTPDRFRLYVTRDR